MELPFKINLCEKTVVITGGGGVLCSEFAKALAKCGAKVALLDINEKSVQLIADEINQSGGKAIGIKADVLSKNSLLQAKEIVNEKFGKCCILINGAGGNHPKGTTSNEYYEVGDIDKDDIKSFFDLDAEGIRFVFDLNFMGTFLTTQVFAKDMVDLEESTIINISSMNAFSPLTKIPAYSGAKASISNFTQWLAVYFSKVNIRVNAIAPGFFVTNQNYNLLFDEDDKPTTRAKKILNATPMNKFGEPKDLIGTLLWLVDNKASAFVNGVVVPVDGGFNAFSGV